MKPKLINRTTLASFITSTDYWDEERLYMTRRDLLKQIKENYTDEEVKALIALFECSDDDGIEYACVEFFKNLQLRLNFEHDRAMGVENL